MEQKSFNKKPKKFISEANRGPIPPLRFLLWLAKIFRFLLRKKHYEQRFIMLMEHLTKFSKDIEPLINQGDITSLIEFYRLSSPWDDNHSTILGVAFDLRSINFGRYHKTIFKLNRLSTLVQQAGRHFYKINKTIKDEPVDGYNIFLGGINNIPIRSADYWLKAKTNNQLPEKFPSLENIPDDYIIQNIETQARLTLESHRGIIKLISSLNRNIV